MNPNTTRIIARIIAGFLAGVMILSLLLSLVGCGSNPRSDAPVTEQTTEAEEETPKAEVSVEDPASETVTDTESTEKPALDEQASSEPEEVPAEDVEEEAAPLPDAPAEELPAEPETPAQPEEPAAPSVITPDTNGMMQVGDSWLQDPGAFNESSIASFASKLQKIRSNYLGGAANVVWSIIPDKSNYAQDRISSYLDHNAMVSKAKAGLSGWTYVEIGNLLSFDDYLLTDGHWRQERIVPVANAIAQALGFSVSKGDFAQKSASGFGGDYAKYSGTTESISWMESAYTAATVCDNFQNPGRTAVYDSGLIHSNSPYDLFAGGPTPLVTLKNSTIDNGRRLIVFRDSFGSSLSPLLLGGYSEIVLIDLRYMSSSLLPQYIDANGADVLFLFSARVVNNSSLLR